MSQSESPDKKTLTAETVETVGAIDELDMDNYIMASYCIETPTPDIAGYCAEVALQQTVGTWVKVHGETPDLRKKHGGRVIQIIKIPDTSHSYLVEIAYPISNLTSDFEMLLATVMGEISWWVAESTGFATKLLDLKFPESFLKEFKGPKFGLPGIRDFLGVNDRPLLNSMIKPNTGHTADVHAAVFREAAFGGVDIIKDDEVLCDIAINPFFERLSKCMEIVDEKKSETGDKTIYCINITTRADKILEKAEKAVQAGANGLLLNSSVGLGVLRMLAEDPSINIPILYHPCSDGMRVASEKGGLSHPLLAKLVRIGGADAMILYSYLGKIPSASKEGNLKVLEQAMCPLKDKKPTGCVLAAGTHPGLVPLLVNDFGADIIIGAGGAVHGHPDGSRAGARAMRQAIDAAMKGIPIAEQAANFMELRRALELWGSPKGVDESKKLYGLRG